MAKRVALCTLDVRGVPHERFPDRLILAVEDAVRQACVRLIKKITHEALYDAEEPQITNEIRNILEEIRCDDGGGPFSERDFGTLIVGGELENYDGQHIQKKPDLTFYCRDRRPGITLGSHDAIFAECKVIGTGRTVHDYATHGIERFVNGEYAWTMPHALMVAYVRDGQQLPQALETYFGMDSGENMKRFQVVCNPSVKKCLMTRKQPSIYVTCHARTWLHRNKVPPLDIELRHLWVCL